MNYTYRDASFFANSNFDAASFGLVAFPPSSFEGEGAFGKTGASPLALIDFLLLNND